MCYTKFSLCIAQLNMEGDLLVKFVFSILLFYTMINLLLVIFYKYTAKYIDLHLSCLIVAFVSFGITYIKPREVRYVVDEKHQYVFKTNSVNWIWDFILHWVPLIFVLIVVPVSRSNLKIVRTFAIIILYMLVTRAPDMYNFDSPMSIVFCILALTIRYCL